MKHRLIGEACFMRPRRASCKKALLGVPTVKQFYKILEKGEKSLALFAHYLACKVYCVIPYSLSGGK